MFTKEKLSKISFIIFITAAIAFGAKTVSDQRNEIRDISTKLNNLALKNKNLNASNAALNGLLEGQKQLTQANTQTITGLQTKITEDESKIAAFAKQAAVCENIRKQLEKNGKRHHAH